MKLQPHGRERPCYIYKGGSSRLVRFSGVCMSSTMVYYSALQGIIVRAMPSSKPCPRNHLSSILSNAAIKVPSA